MEVSLNHGGRENALKELGREDKLESVWWTGEAQECDVCIDDFMSF